MVAGWLRRRGEGRCWLSNRYRDAIVYISMEVETIPKPLSNQQLGISTGFSGSILG